MTNDTNDVPGPRWDSKCRRVIHATGVPHQGPVGFTILVMSTRSGAVEPDPHAISVRTVTLSEDRARVLRDALAEWLR
ncbi:MAG: hypothetical protein ACRDRW_19855 [Pseudonocardiaceae bacterium]